MAVMAFLCFSAGAVVITHDGVNYYTRKSTNTEVEVNIYNIDKTTGDSAFYTGDENGVLVIPESFEENGRTYTVIGVNSQAFLNCRDLKQVVLPATCVTLKPNCFSGCTSLEVSPLHDKIGSIQQGAFIDCKSLTEVEIPAEVTTPLNAYQFAGSGIKRLIIAPSETPLVISIDAFKLGTSAAPPIEELIMHRDLGVTDLKNNQMPFHNYATLKRVVMDQEATTLPASYFIGCTNLEEVVFGEGNKVSTIANAVFSGCTKLPSIEFPAGVTSVAENTFYNCRSLTEFSSVNPITYIGGYAFYGTKALKSFAFPAELTTIGAGAFSEGGLEGVLDLNSGLRTVGANAFAGANDITDVNIPASLSSIGEGAFAPITSLQAINVDEGNSAFRMQDGVLVNAAGKRILVNAHEGGLAESFALSTVESIDPYGLAFSPFKEVDLPGLTNLGNFAFYKSALQEFTYRKEMTLGMNVFTASDLETMNIEEGAREVPQKLCYQCEKLSTVNFSSTVTNVMQDAFAECPALETMTIGQNINYMEKGAVPSTIKTLRVLNMTPPVLGAGVFEPSQSNVDCYVGAAKVDDFKNANQWGYLNIIGDEAITGEGTTLGCPSGLYFATTDGRLMYKDTEGEIIDTEFKTGEHAFSLASYKNRIYVASAGKRFTYQDPSAGAGDGELFYVNKTNDLFYRVTVLNNVGYNAFEDPFQMTILPDENKIFIADRNVGIHEMSADTVGLYGQQPFFVKNGWLGYYNNGFSYGAIQAGFQKRAHDVVDTEGTVLDNVYWMAKKFNGQGIFRFTADRIDNSSDAAGDGHFADWAMPILFNDVQMTTFYIDEENEYLYLFVQSDLATQAVPGVYRVPLSVIAEKQAEATIKDDAELIDDSPIKLEGGGNEVTGVTQFVGDGKYVYWAYISPETDDATKALPNMTAYDASNPLHHSGIKRVAATKPEVPEGEAEENAEPAAPVVEFEIEGVTAYGVALSTYVPEENPDEPIPGDVNGDGSVNAGDVSAVYNVMLGTATDPEIIARADVNGDGSVNAGDVSAVYNVMLSGE